MKRFLVLAICGALAVGHVTPLQAGGICGVRGVRQAVTRRHAVQTQVVQAKIVTPYAVALGVPVANYSGVVYSYNAYGAQSAAAASNGQIKQAVKEALLEILQRSDGELAPLAETSTPSLVEQNCAACHSGELAKGGFRVDQPLDDAARLNASRQVLLGEMPRGKQLDEQTRGNLLGELVGAVEE